MTLKEYMASACTKYQMLIMKGLWESPSPEQEQIIALTAAVSSLKSRTGKAPGGRAVTGKQRVQVTPRSGPLKNEGDYAWKDIAPKAGDLDKKQVKGKDCFWCTRHKQPQWTLHNPDSFPNLCKYDPKYAELEAAWKASSNNAGEALADDIKLESALAAIQDSESESEDL
jgi:hypothetical protein